MRWVLLDEVVVIQKKVKALTRSHVPQTEFSPEILMIEMMAQTGALLLGAENDFQEDLVFAKIENAAFENHFRSGESVQIEAWSDELRPEGAWMEGRIEKDGVKIAQSRFLLMNMKHLLPTHQEPITFHSNFMDHFQIRDKVK